MANYSDYVPHVCKYPNGIILDCRSFLVKIVGSDGKWRLITPKDKFRTDPDDEVWLTKDELAEIDMRSKL